MAAVAGLIKGLSVSFQAGKVLGLIKIKKPTSEKTGRRRGFVLAVAWLRARFDQARASVKNS
jgi:hypothetical protein